MKKGRSFLGFWSPESYLPHCDYDLPQCDYHYSDHQPLHPESKPGLFCLCHPFMLPAWTSSQQNQMGRRLGKAGGSVAGQPQAPVVQSKVEQAQSRKTTGGSLASALRGKAHNLRSQDWKPSPCLTHSRHVTLHTLLDLSAPQSCKTKLSTV